MLGVQLNAMARLTCITLLLSVLLTPGAALAQTSGLDFLNVGPDTRSLALAEAVTTVPIGGSAIYTNPANLVLESSSSLSAAYSLWIADVYNSHVAVNLKRDRQALAFGLLNSSTDELEARLTPGPSDGPFSVSYLSLSAGYARSFGNIAIGIAGHFLREEYYLNNASGYAVSAGVLSRWLEGRLRAGIALLNLGEMNKLAEQATKLPLNVRAGLGVELFEYVPPGNPDLPILVSFYGDYVKPIDEDISRKQIGISYTAGGSLNLGLSLDMDETVTVNGGYKTGNTDRPVGFGIGLKLESFHFDYAVVPFNTGFGTVHSIGLQYRL